MKTSPEPRRLHYGWIICAGCLLLHACTCGLTTSAISAYTPYLKQALGFNNTQTSLILTVRALSSMLVMLTCDRYYRRLSLRAGTTLSCLIVAAACVLFAWSKTPAMCYLAAAVMGVAYAYGTMVPISLFMRNWFADCRSTAIAVAACGSAVTTTVAPPLVTWMAETVGLSATFLAEAGIVVLCGAVLFLILRDSPEELGLAPYTLSGRGQAAAVAEAVPEAAPAQGSSAPGRRDTLLLLGAVFLVGCCGAPYLSHITIHCRGAGFSAAQAALVLSIVGAVMVAGKFLYGLASDRFGSYRTNYVFLGCWVAAAFLTGLLRSGSDWMLYCSGILNGIGIPLGTVGVTVWVGDFWTGEHYSKYITKSQFIFSVGTLLWSPVPGAVADLTGSYSQAYLIFGGMLLAALLIVQSTYRRCGVGMSKHI